MMLPFMYAWKPTTDNNLIHMYKGSFRWRDLGSNSARWTLHTHDCWERMRLVDRKYKNYHQFGYFHSNPLQGWLKVTQMTECVMDIMKQQICLGNCSWPVRSWRVEGVSHVTPWKLDAVISSAWMMHREGWVHQSHPSSQAETFASSLSPSQSPIDIYSCIIMCCCYCHPIVDNLFGGCQTGFCPSWNLS